MDKVKSKTTESKDVGDVEEFSSTSEEDVQPMATSVTYVANWVIGKSGAQLPNSKATKRGKRHKKSVRNWRTNPKCQNSPAVESPRLKNLNLKATRATEKANTTLQRKSAKRMRLKALILRRSQAMKRRHMERWNEMIRCEEACGNTRKQDGGREDEGRDKKGMVYDR